MAEAGGTSGSLWPNSAPVETPRARCPAPRPGAFGDLQRSAPSPALIPVGHAFPNAAKDTIMFFFKAYCWLVFDLVPAKDASSFSAVCALWVVASQGGAMKPSEGQKQ